MTVLWVCESIFFSKIASKCYRRWLRMKYFFEAILYTSFVAVLANSSVKPAESDSNVKKAHPDMINNYYAGPYCKKFEQHLAEIQQEIRTLMENQTCGPTGGEQSSEVKKELAEIRKDIRALRENTSLSPGLSAGMKNHLAEIKQEIRALGENLTCCLDGKDLLSEMKQQVAEMKQEIRELKENLTRGPSRNDLLSYMKHQLAELKEEMRAFRGNKTECPGGKGL